MTDIDALVAEAFSTLDAMVMAERDPYPGQMGHAALIRRLARALRAMQVEWARARRLMDHTTSLESVERDHHKARAEAAEAERDRWEARAHQWGDDYSIAMRRAEAAEQALAEARPVLEYVSLGRGAVGVSGPYPDAAARRVLGLPPFANLPESGATS